MNFGILSDRFGVPGRCPNCDTLNTCNVLKARLRGKDQTIGWICKKCFYYFIFPLKKVLKV